MNVLQIYLPKDIVNIVEEYSKDRTQYDRVIRELDYFSVLSNMFPLRRTIRYYHCMLTNPGVCIYEIPNPGVSIYHFQNPGESIYYSQNRSFWENDKILKTGRPWVRLNPWSYFNQ